MSYWLVYVRGDLACDQLVDCLESRSLQVGKGDQVQGLPAHPRLLGRRSPFAPGVIGSGLSGNRGGPRFDGGMSLWGALKLSEREGLVFVAQVQSPVPSGLDHHAVPCLGQRM